MKKHILWLAMLAAMSTGAQAQDMYGGLGLPGLYTLGYAHPMGSGWGLRGEYAGGLSWNGTGTDNGISYNASLKSSRAGLFADWFPFSGGFRFVGGVTANDQKMDVNSQATGTATINNKPVNMATYYYNVNLKYPTATPYLGIGYGHQATTKGLGFYADMGVTFGSFSAEVSTNVVDGVSGVSQADVDVQKQKMNDSLGGFKYLPSFSLGLVYRY
jgi:hypothetical protein